MSFLKVYATLCGIDVKLENDSITSTDYFHLGNVAISLYQKQSFALP